MTNKLKFSLAMGCALAVVTAIAMVSKMRSQNHIVGVTKKSIGSEVPSAIFLGETGDRVDLKQTIAQTERTWLVPVFYKCPGACTVVIERVLERVHQSPSMQASLGHHFQLIFFSFDPKETFQLASEKRQSALTRNSLTQQLDSIRFLSGGGSSGDMVTRSLKYHYAWDEKMKSYNHDLKVFEVDKTGIVTAEFSLDELNTLAVAER